MPTSSAPSTATPFPEPLADDDNPDPTALNTVTALSSSTTWPPGRLNAAGIKTATITASVAVKQITPLVECSGPAQTIEA